ncbi:MAG TPA: hypothetical protein DCZ69_14235, partial [Syntrophobacteraceae bacterium]|nr:hypothetical protein [Syntrophobacteraceae bacterium]
MKEAHDVQINPHGSVERVSIMLRARSKKLFRQKTDGRPMHYRLQQEIRRGIESGQWAPGSVIPPERKMAQEFGVSLGTVRTAILNLVAEGLLYRIQGKGTMVAGSKMIRESIRYYRFV